MAKTGTLGLLKSLFSLPLAEMLQLFSQKFQQHEVFHVIKSLSYFEDAENYPDPLVFDKSVTWAKVKTTIRKAVKSLTIVTCRKVGASRKRVLHL
jgi:hypothetical protein